VSLLRRLRIATLVAALLAVLARLAPVAGRRVVEARVERRFNVLTPAAPRHVSERARELHRTLFVADLHADSLLYGRDLVRRSSIGHVDVPRLIEGGIALQALSACVRVASHLNVERNEDTSDDVRLLAFALGWPPGTWASGLARALHLASRARAFAARSGGRLTIVDSAGGLADYLARRRIDPALTAGWLTIEGAAALDGDLANVDRVADAGFRMFALTHMVDNVWAGSSTGVGRGGLTPAGHDLVARLEDRSLLVDVAHASAATVDDVLRIARRPVVASHTGIAGVVPSPRNLSDEHVAGIAATGGVVGIGFWPAVTGGDDAAAIARSIVHAVGVAGIDHVALGSDFDGAVPVPFDAAGIAQLTDALLAEGFGDAEVGQVMGGNVLRLLEACLPV
jgi:microsomal dipeptidase-like Zn-dependent dipeptidase